MKVYKDFNELKNGPSEVFEYIKGLDDNYEIHNHSFMDWYGGNIHVIETKEDLREITIYGKFSESNPDEWETLADVAGCFEICEFLPTGTYVNIYTTTSDAGGPTYFIPFEIAIKCPTVLESIELSKGEGE